MYENNELIAKDWPQTPQTEFEHRNSERIPTIYLCIPRRVI